MNQVRGEAKGPQDSLGGRGKPACTEGGARGGGYMGDQMYLVCRGVIHAGLERRRVPLNKGQRPLDLGDGADGGCSSNRPRERRDLGEGKKRSMTSIGGTGTQERILNTWQKEEFPGKS